MANITKKTRVIEGCKPHNIPEEVLSSTEPLILRGLIKDWPLVQAGLQSNEHAVNYLKSFYNGQVSKAYFGSSDIKGRYSYNDNLTNLNFEIRKAKLDDVLDLIIENITNPTPPAFYIASNLINDHFPNLSVDNHLTFNQSLMAGIEPFARLWAGNSSLVPCHFDSSRNIACCAVGKRRFTLFPSEQINNLYPGPLDPTPGGQVISLVNFEKPDLDTYPKFSEAIAAGQVADLNPGDALFIPSVWWHQVEGLNNFNILINYWWEMASKYNGSVINVLDHALLSIRDLPDAEKQAWKHIFDYYIFGPSEQATHHLPKHVLGNLGEINQLKARRLRAMLLNKLNG